MGPNYEFSICVARIFNRPETLANIFLSVKDANFGYIREVLRQMQELGQQVWSGAYLITTHGRKMSKLDYCMEILEQAHHYFNDDIHWGNPPRLSIAHDHILNIEGFGSFLAAQVVADLKNTEGHPLQNADDWMTFSAPGPGSLRGLSWFHNRPITVATYQSAIESVHRHLLQEHNISGIHFQDLQNCLCEFDKYCRVATGTGRSKRKYRGI